MCLIIQRYNMWCSTRLNIRPTFVFNIHQWLDPYLHLSKAFDTINQKILREKLELDGIRGVVLKWLADYLSDRKQFVEYNSCSSSYKDITCGVPQGWILGPLLFLIYISMTYQMYQKKNRYFLQMTLVYFYRATSQMTWLVKWTTKWNIIQNGCQRMNCH